MEAPTTPMVFIKTKFKIIFTMAPIATETNNCPVFLYARNADAKKPHKHEKNADSVRKGICCHAE